ncbi:MAG: methylated-DNA--[protein]-cysteine S-methyltransferase [Rhabdochlamydiaceae bacterium]
MDLSSSFVIYQQTFPSPIGLMVALANDSFLIFLGFLEDPLFNEVRRDLSKNGCFIHEKNKILKTLFEQLEAYFSQRLRSFDIPIQQKGTPFQQTVWSFLQAIPFGETLSYQEQSLLLALPKAIRAVANANGANKILILIPCHRVVRKSGLLGGYRGGLNKKQWLLNHERLLLQKG